MRTLLLCLLAFAAVQTDVSIADQGIRDPLFERMQGQWRGEGERVFAPRGRKVRFEADVVSRVVDDKLVSENRITETPIVAPGEPAQPGRQYLRTYWLRAHASDLGKYELGYGEGADETVFSTGQFDAAKNLFVVIQKMGGEGGLVFHSETQFLNAGETQYTQIDWYGDTQAAQTSVRYVRVVE